MEHLLNQFIDTLEKTRRRFSDDGVDGLTVSQVQYLEAVHALEQPTATEVASVLSITKASVTAGIQKLVEKGFLTRAQSESDRRVYHIRLTEKAVALAEAREKTLNEYGALIRAALTDEEAEKFESILHKLVDYFQNINFEKEPPRS